MAASARRSGRWHAFSHFSVLSWFGDHGEAIQENSLRETFGPLLQPGEVAIAYSGRMPVPAAQADVLGYSAGGFAQQTDVFYYPHTSQSPQTDAFAYDLERASRQPDVMGYQGGGDIAWTDAFAYNRRPPSRDTDIFMCAAGDGHLRVLTDRRLIQGQVSNDRLVLTETAIPTDEMSLPSSLFASDGEEWRDWPFFAPSPSKPARASSAKAATLPLLNAALWGGA
jgi:hypothetical protein